MRRFTALRPPFNTFLNTIFYIGRVTIFEKHNMESAYRMRFDSG